MKQVFVNFVDSDKINKVLTNIRRHWDESIAEAAQRSLKEGLEYSIRAEHDIKYQDLCLSRLYTIKKIGTVLKEDGDNVLVKFGLGDTKVINRKYCIFF